MTRVSVVIPALNDSPMLANALRALAVQSRPADEIIVVDNGSTDDTAAVARASGARVIEEPLRGIFPATAAGFDAATGDLIARLDADSVPPSDWIQRVVDAFETDSELAALSGPGDFYGSNPVVHWVAENLYIGGYIWFVGWLVGHAPLFGSNLALRSSTWVRLRTTVHRSMREIHDDLDLAIHIHPDMPVVFDRTLRVGVSARPFASLSSLGRRLKWAYTTLNLNSREKPFSVRRAEQHEWDRNRAEEAFG